jgi:hypothetical protein
MHLGWAVKSFAEAGTLRGFGGIIHFQTIYASGHFEEKATEQRAGRWRAANTLLDNDGVNDGTELGRVEILSVAPNKIS